VPAHVDAAVTLEQWRGSGQPVLSTGDLTLRPWSPGDVDTVVAAYSDPGIQRWHVQDMTPDEARTWLESRGTRWDTGGGADWAVAGADGEVVGRIGFNRLGLFEGDAEVAYWVLPSARGRRVAPRALECLTAWAFDTAGLHRLGLRHSVANEPSCRVAEHAGFAFEGTLRRSGRHADGDHDMHLHARVRDD
jgi:RimJ/RimL family protein N-acetyltransferase